MQRPFLILLLLLSGSLGFGQSRVPVFGSKADSITYAELTNKLSDAMRNPRYTFRIDSLTKALIVVREKAIGYRTEYHPSMRYTRYDQRPQDGASVTRLSLVDYRGKELPDSLFLLTNLQELELINTRIRKLPARLGELKNLKKISLLNNRPKARVSLGKNNRITTLVIHDDEVNRLPRNFRNYPNLEVLDLSRCNLDRFPRLRGVSKLKSLHLTENKVTLQDLRKGIPNLEELVLTSNAIKVVPGSIGKFPALKKLNLNANQIEQLAPEIGSLSKLEQLSLYKNSLKTLPRSIYRLTNLRVIDLYYNQLDQLDTAVRHWQKLEILYAANNKLYTLPETLGELHNLRELYLHHNRISVLPASLGHLDSLRVLRVNNNHLVEFPSSLLRLPSLENLDLSANSLSNIPEELFNYPRLQIISLLGNPLDPSVRTQAQDWARKAMQNRSVIIHLDGRPASETPSDARP